MTVIEGSRAHRLWQAGGLALAVVVVVAVAVTQGDFRLTQFAQAVPYAVAVLGLNLVTGYTGQVSLGHAAFFGIGAYTSAILVAGHGWPYLATIPVAGAVGLVVGVAVGIPALRVRGLYLAVVTLSVGVAFPVLVTQPFAIDLGTGGVSGRPVYIDWIKPSWFNLNVSDTGWKFIVVTAIAGLLFWLATGMVRSRVGRSMHALRDSETAAAVSGVWPAGVKVGAFAVSALYGAAGGALYVLVTPVISPDVIGFQITLLLITAMVLGGATSVSGAWIGGLVMVFLPYYASDWVRDAPVLSNVSGESGLFANVLYGLILIALVFFMPSGIAPALGRLRARFLTIVPVEALTPPANIRDLSRENASRFRGDPGGTIKEKV